MGTDGTDLTMKANHGATVVETGTNYTMVVEVNGDNEAFFRGILIRLAVGRRHADPTTDVSVDEDKLVDFGLKIPAFAKAMSWV